MNLVMGYQTSGAKSWQNALRASQNTSPVVVYEPVTEDWRPRVEQRLAKLSAYAEGWDGYSAMPPQPSIIAYARSTLNSVMMPSTPAPSIVPLSGGGLQLEWHTNGYDIELAIYAAGEAELSVSYPDDREPIEDKVITVSLYDLSAVIEEFA